MFTRIHELGRKSSAHDSCKINKPYTHITMKKWYGWIPAPLYTSVRVASTENTASVDIMLNLTRCIMLVSSNSICNSPHRNGDPSDMVASSLLQIPKVEKNEKANCQSYQAIKLSWFNLDWRFRSGNLPHIGRTESVSVPGDSYIQTTVSFTHRQCARKSLMIFWHAHSPPRIFLCDWWLITDHWCASPTSAAVVRCCSVSTALCFGASKRPFAAQLGNRQFDISCRSWPPLLAPGHGCAWKLITIHAAHIYSKIQNGLWILGW